MKPYLVDVAVALYVWKRPDRQKMQFEVIKKARPSILFLLSDNGRDEREKHLVAESRKIVEDIDWNCTVYKMYENENQGLYSMGVKSLKFVWEKVEACIFLEDDLLPSISYFQYCAELLEKYADDLRVSVICGFNHLGIYDKTTSDYFFARQGCIWGVAMWKRTYEQYYDFAYGDDPYVMELLKQRTKHNKVFWKRLQSYAKNDYYEGHIAASEFFLEFSMYGQNQLQIIPKKNLISNIGYGEDSAHSTDLKKMPHAIRKIFNSFTYELNFPLKHAAYVIPDIKYEKERNKIMGYNYKWGQFCAKIETLFLHILCGDMKSVKKMINKKIRKIAGIFEYEREK